MLLENQNKHENASEGEYNYKYIPERIKESGEIILYELNDEIFDKNFFNILHIFIDHQLFSKNEDNLLITREISKECSTGYIEKQINENYFDGFIIKKIKL